MMNDNLPPSLNRFAAELEQAICHELAPREHRLVRLPRGRPRLLLGTTIGAAGTGAVLAIVLTAVGSAPAFAVTRNRDGGYSVTLRSLSAIPAANRKLSQIGVNAKLVQGPSNCQPPQTVEIPPPTAPAPTSPSQLQRPLEIEPPTNPVPASPSHGQSQQQQIPIPVCGFPPPRRQLRQLEQQRLR